MADLPRFHIGLRMIFSSSPAKCFLEYLHEEGHVFNTHLHLI
jgi:hypothetical protein